MTWRMEFLTLSYHSERAGKRRFGGIGGLGPFTPNYHPGNLRELSNCYHSGNFHGNRYCVSSEITSIIVTSKT